MNFRNRSTNVSVTRIVSRICPRPLRLALLGTASLTAAWAQAVEPPINPTLSLAAPSTPQHTLSISRSEFHDRLQGFWLGQCIANWTGLITEMDKIGGTGPHGTFYTRADWGGPDQPSIWGEGLPSDLSSTIDWYLVGPDGTWGADDDTDIEYLYQSLLLAHETVMLTGAQIRNGWLRHIYHDGNTPFTTTTGEPENFLWVSNQAAHDLMRREGLAPPDTSDPARNPHTDMIDAQLTTEIFGLFAPGRPDLALAMADLPIATTARGEAALAARFYVFLHALAAAEPRGAISAERLFALVAAARADLPDASTTARMVDFVRTRHAAGDRWEQARDAVYQRYQVDQADGYDITSRDLYCNGCFAAGINFAASLVSLLWGGGDYQETVRIAVLAGWDSDNPAATWGGLLGFMLGADELENTFGQRLSRNFNIHRTRGGFPNDGQDTFPRMATDGVWIVDRVVQDAMGGAIDQEHNRWLIPGAKRLSP